MSGSVLLRALRARFAGAPKAALAVFLSVVLTVSLTPAISWATEDADAQQPVVEEAADPYALEPDASGEVPASDSPEQPEGEALGEGSAPVVNEDGSADQEAAPSDEPEAPAETPVETLAATDAQPQDAAEQDATQIQAVVSFIGVDAQGADQIWAAQKTYSLDEGTTADVISEKILTDAGLTADYGVTTWGWSLNTVTSPVDGKAYGWDAETGKYWQMFVNGAPSDFGASSVVLQDGDVITWYYSAWGASLPQGDVPGMGEGSEGSGSEGQDPDEGGEEGEGSGSGADAPAVDLPDYEAAWPNYAAGGAGALNGVSTPSDAAELLWSSVLKPADDWNTSVSDAIVVNGDIYIAVGNALYCKDAATGQIKASVTLADSINSTARIAYADGVIVVPLAKGRLQALAADTLTTAWMTDALPAGSAGDQQSLTTLTVSDGRVYYGTASADWTATYGGFFLCVDLQTGRVLWSYEDNSAGFYWAGAAMSGSFAIIANDNGSLRSFNADGSVAATLDLGVRVRSTVVADGSTVYVVSNDGVLHKISVAADGSMTEVASVAFGSSSTSTPVLANGKVIVAGASTQSYANSWGGTSYYGVLAVIDAASMTVEHSITALADGTNLPADSKSAPLVSVQNGKAYVYFTCNSTPGGVYRYCVGDATAQEIYVPQADLQNYCMASVIADANGTLYYTNDSGALFALKGVASAEDPGKDDGEGGQTPDKPSDNDEPSKPSNPAKPDASSKPQANGQGEADNSADVQNAPVAGGAVAPSSQPVSQPVNAFGAAGAEAQNGEEGQDGEGAPSASKEEAASDSLTAGAADASDESSDASASDEGASDGGLNPLAVAGVVAGLAGLGAIAAFLLKRRNN